MNVDIYQLVTDRIVGLLELGTVPWRKPWKGVSEAPQNLVSKRAYRGINSLVLHSCGWESPFWLTFRQAHTLGGSVKKGEKSVPVVFWKLFEDEKDGEKRKRRYLRYSSVFNLIQCEGVKFPPRPTEAPDFKPIGKCEEVVEKMPMRPKIVHGFAEATYSPLHDWVRMPDQASFAPHEAYYSTLFHELVHATGHKSRVGRKGVTEGNAFGSDPYCREELVAEMGAAFLCGHCGIDAKTINDSASYIGHWLLRLKSDKKLVVKAAADAQKAADFILNQLPAAEAEAPHQETEPSI